MYTRIDSESIYIWQVACSSWLFISSFFHVAFILRSILLIMRKRSCDSIHFLFVALFFFFSFPDDALLISNRCANVETRTYSCCSVAFSHLYFSRESWKFEIFFFFFSFTVCWSLIELYVLLFFNITFWFARLGLFALPSAHWRHY